MGRGAYLAATRGGTDRAAARAFSDRAQRSYSSQQNNQTGQNNQGTRQSSFDLKSGTSGKDNEIRNADGLTQAEVKQMKALADKRNEAAYQASLAKQEDMRKAMNLAYNTVNNQQQSNFQNLSDSQKQFLIDSGFAAAESEGILGGTMGAELVSNQLKQNLANATNEQEFNDALAALDRLHGGGEKGQAITDQMAEMGLLQHDPSAVYSFGDVESNPQLYQAYQDMASKNLTPEDYTNYMNQISAFGHGAPKGISGYGGGYGGSYGGGYGGGEGGGYAGLKPYPQQGIAQPPGVGPGTLQEQVNQGFLGGMGSPRFSRGGIVSLLRLRR
jgi:hypothetical protein